MIPRNPILSRAFVLVGCVIAVATLPLTVSAQNYEKTAPPELEQAAPPPELKPDFEPNAVPFKGDPDRVLVPEVRTIAIVLGGEGKAAITIPGGMLRTGVIIVDLPNADTPQLRDALEARIGKPVTLGEIQEIVNIVNRYYRDIDRPVVNVYVPEQDITDGEIQIHVVEGSVGAVKSEGAKWFSNKRIRKELTLDAGDPINFAQLRADLQWMNRNPFRTTEVVFAPGEAFGTTNVVLRNTDRFPLRAYTSYDNTGTRSTKLDRYSYGFQFGKLPFLDWSGSYQLQTNGHLDQLETHSGNLSIPLPWRETVTVFGSYSTTAIPLQGGAFDSEGESWQFGLRYPIDLPKLGKVSQSLQVGIDYKRSNNNIEFGGTQIQNTFHEIVQGTVSYRASRPDALGQTAMGIELVYSPGEITDDNRDRNFDSSNNQPGSRQGADSNYTYTILSLNRVWRLPMDWTLRNRFEGQLSTDNLLSSEQLGLGGFNSVRGYDYREFNRDNGFVFSTELVTPAHEFGPLLDLESANTVAQLRAFWDYGQGSVAREEAAVIEDVDIASIGLGGILTIGRHFSLNADYGWQMLEPDAAQGSPYESRLHINARLSF